MALPAPDAPRAGAGGARGRSVDPVETVPLRRLPEAFGDLGGDVLPVILCEQGRGLVRADSPELEAVDPARLETAPLTVPEAKRSVAESATSRLAAKSTASVVGQSSHWASSTTTRSGLDSAAAASRLSVVASIVKRSCSSGSQSSNALRRALACWDGIWGRCSRSGRSSSREAGELQLGLGLDAERAHDRHPLRLLDRVLQQGRLADPGLAVHDEGAGATRRARLSSASTTSRSRSRPTSLGTSERCGRFSRTVQFPLDR
jgi:hypothetical protein